MEDGGQPTLGGAGVTGTADLAPIEALEATGATMGPVTMMRMRRGRGGGQGSTRAKGGPLCRLQCGSRQYQFQFFSLPLVAPFFVMVFFLPVDHAEYKLSHMAAILKNTSHRELSVVFFLTYRVKI